MTKTVRTLLGGVCLVAAIATAPLVWASIASDDVKWSAPGWYVIRWVQEDVAYDVVKGPFLNEANCKANLDDLTRQNRPRDEGQTLECRNLTTAPP